MSRYLQKITLGAGKVRWIGWWIDGVGTEIPGLILADGLSPDDVTKLGVKQFVPMAFEEFLGIGSQLIPKPEKLDDKDLEFRLDHLRVAIDRLASSEVACISKEALKEIFSGVSLADTRIQARLLEWESSGNIQVLGTDECYLKIVRRFH